MKIIDAHVHIVPETAMGEVDPRFGGCLEPYGFQRLPDGSGYQAMPPWFHDSRFTPEALIKTMDVYGVEKAVIQQSVLRPMNEAVAAAVKRWPDRLAGAMILEPGQRWQEQLRYWKARGLGAIKFEMRAFSMAWPEIGYDHPWMTEVLELAGREELTVVFDPAPTDFPVYRPEAFCEAVYRHPQTRVVLCHLGFPAPLETQAQREKWSCMIQAARLPNCWVDVSAMPDLFDGEGWPYETPRRLLTQLVEDTGGERMIWGSDIPGTLCRATYPQMQTMFSRGGLLSQEQLEILLYRGAKEAYRL